MHIVENYCKINYGGKLPPKHKLSNVVMHALEAGNRNVLSEPLKQAKSRKNPAQSFLENHGVVFPWATDTNKSFSDLVSRCRPVTKEEEEEQLNMVLKQSLIESGSKNTQQARNPPACLPNYHHSSYYGAYMPPFSPGMMMVPPLRLYAPFQSQINPSLHEGSITRSTLQPTTQCFEHSLAGTDICSRSSSLQTATEPEMLTEDETAKETAQLLLSLNSKTS